VDRSIISFLGCPLEKSLDGSHAKFRGDEFQPLAENPVGNIGGTKPIDLCAQSHDVAALCRENKLLNFFRGWDGL
jgi:hypothetical protein